MMNARVRGVGALSKHFRGEITMIAEAASSAPARQDELSLPVMAKLALNYLRGNPERGASCWDTINSGHKELYINTLAYRAFCCMADLEKRLKRSDKAARYADLAGKLKAACLPLNISRAGRDLNDVSAKNWQNYPMPKEVPVIPLLVNYPAP